MLRALSGNFSGSSRDPIDKGVIAKLMETIKIHAKADAYGVLHLDVPVSEPNSEFDIEIAVNPSHTPIRRERPYAWDCIVSDPSLQVRLAVTGFLKQVVETDRKIREQGRRCSPET